MGRSSRNHAVGEHILWYEKSAENFNEALPLGNGRIGACIYGGVAKETISLNEDTLWSGYPKKPAEENYPEIYKKACNLCREEKFVEAQELLEDNFGDYLVQMYLPLGQLKIDHACIGEISGYRRELCLDEAVHRVRYYCDGKEYVRESFISPVSQTLILRFSCSESGKISFTTWLESQLKYSVAEVNGCLCMEGHAPDCVSEYGKGYPCTDCQIYSEDPFKQGMGFAAALSVKNIGGSVRTEKGKIVVAGADEVILHVAIRTGFVSWDVHPAQVKTVYRERCLFEIKKAEQTPYSKLFREHREAHKELYDRCLISLGTSRNSGLPTDQRLFLHHEGQQDLALYTLLFNYGKYLVIASSRKGTQPANLQGIWNEKLLPPWNSNYTLNINTQMNYWSVLPCGLEECYEPFIKMAEELAQSGKGTAHLYYGVDGWVCHHSSDIWRLTHPGTNRIKKNAQWGFWNMSSGWISIMLWEYYCYTADIAYLRRVYPVMEGAARFYRQLLTELDGKLVLSPSSSPENNYIENGKACALDESTAMTQEILYGLFEAVSKAQEILGKRQEYKGLLHKLKRPEILADGTLCEWDWEHKEWDVHHRHLSHLYGLFPGSQFDQAQKKGAEKSLIRRGDDGTGWSLAWKINLWARLGDGQHALKLLDNQLKSVPSTCDTPGLSGGSYPNLLCAHPPFQIDGNFGVASGMIQMLVQTDEAGNPLLLPALPESWVEGEVEGICLPGRKKISFTWRESKVVNWELTEY